MIKLLTAKKLALTLLLATAHGSAVFDAWSTRRALRVPGARESNPMVRPFSRNGTMYAATQGDLIVPELLLGRLPGKWKWVGYAWLVAAAGMHAGLGVQNVVVGNDSSAARLPAWRNPAGTSQGLLSPPAGWPGSNRLCPFCGISPPINGAR